MNLLIIEDEAKTAAYLRRGLSESGFVMDVATHNQVNAEMIAASSAMSRKPTTVIVFRPIPHDAANLFPSSTI